MRLDGLLTWLRGAPDAAQLAQDETQRQVDVMHEDLTLLMARMARAEEELRARGWLSLAPLPLEDDDDDV